jgi:hypothetical protein
LFLLSKKGEQEAMSNPTINLAKESLKKSRKRPIWYLAICLPERMGTYEILGDSSYKSREEAFQSAKKQPEVLEHNDVRIISISDRLMVKRRETIKITI